MSSACEHAPADADAIVAAAKADLATQPVHRFDWTCPLGCGQQWAVEVRLDGLARAARQLVRTVERHMEAGCIPS